MKKTSQAPLARDHIKTRRQAPEYQLVPTGDHSLLPSPFRHPRSASGFTLIEVVVAVAILVAVMVPLLGAISYGLQNVTTMQNRSLALRLAQDKMTEIEMLKFPEAEGKEEGDFGPEYPDFHWEVELVKSPEIQLMESQIPSLKGMEVHLTVSWTEGGATKSLELYSLLLE